MIAPLRHVFLARPEELHGRARNFLRNQDGLGHIIGESTPAEAAARMNLMHVALADGQAGRLRGCGERGFAVLRRAPDLAALGRVERRRIHRLHARVVLERIVVDRLDSLRRTGDGGLRISGFVVDECLLH